MSGAVPLVPSRVDKDNFIIFVEGKEQNFNFWFSGEKQDGSVLSKVLYYAISFPMNTGRSVSLLYTTCL